MATLFWDKSAEETSDFSIKEGSNRHHLSLPYWNLLIARVILFMEEEEPRKGMDWNAGRIVFYRRVLHCACLRSQVTSVRAAGRAQWQAGTPGCDSNWVKDF